MKHTKFLASLSVIFSLSLLHLFIPALQPYSWADDFPKTRLAVIGFEKRGEKIPVPDLELIVNDWLIEFLVNTNTFEVVERQALEKVLQEQSLGQSGILDPESAAKVGQLLGVDVLISGTLMYLGGTLEVTARMIDTGNGSIIGAASVSTDDEDEIRNSVERLASLLRTKLSPAIGEAPALLSENFDDDHAWTEQWNIDFEETMKQAEKDATKVSQEDGALRISGKYRKNDEHRLFWIFPTVWQKYQSIEAKVRFRDLRGGGAVCLDMTWGDDEKWTGFCPYVEEDYSDITIELDGQEEPFTLKIDIRPDRWYVMRLDYQDGMFSYYWEDQLIKRLAVEPAISASDEFSLSVVFMLEETRSILIEIDQLVLR